MTGMTGKWRKGLSSKPPPWIGREYSSNRVLAFVTHHTHHTHHAHHTHTITLHPTHVAPRLHQEVEDFTRYMMATEAEMQMRRHVVAELQQVVHTLWPRAQV